MPKLFAIKKPWIYIACSLVVIFTLSLPSFSSDIKHFSARTLSAPIRFFQKTMRNFRAKRSVDEENRLLRKNVAELYLQVERFKDLRNENDRLRELLKFKKKITFDTVLAEVIARNPNDWVGSFTIDKGAIDGISKNSAVCSARGLLGRVVDLNSNTSSVMLLTHPGFKTGGIVKDTRINGAIAGGGKGTVKMLYIPVDADVRKGSMVMTSGFSRIFPKGITIGEIFSVGISKTGLYKYAIIKPSAHLFDQEEVLCIK